MSKFPIETKAFEGKRILVTGGTGTIGTRLVAKLLETKASRITIYSRDEMKVWDRERIRPDDRLHYRIGDVRNYESVRQAVDQADLIFHCAAMKHVPICETGAGEAAMTNVVGAENVVRAMMATERPMRAVCCSTDKACQPDGVMGLTKAIQERIFRRAGQVSCRFGNVPGARGSVIPLWKSSLETYGHMNMTDPAMTRFLLPVDWAAEGLMRAITDGQPGDILIPAGMRSCTIGMLAKVIQERYSGREIRIIGPRPGEKQHEEIVTEEESRYARPQHDGWFALGQEPLEPKWRERFTYRSDDPDCLITEQAELAAFLVNAEAI